MGKIRQEMQPSLVGEEMDQNHNDWCNKEALKVLDWEFSRASPQPYSISQQPHSATSTRESKTGRSTQKSMLCALIPLNDECCEWKRVVRDMFIKCLLERTQGHRGQATGK